MALMAKASSSMGDRRVDRPVACGVLTVPWRVTCGVFLLSFFLFNTLLFQEFQRRRRVGGFFSQERHAKIAKWGANLAGI